MRPKTLAEVAQLTLNGESFDRCLANFLDEFYAVPNAQALAHTPPWLAQQCGEFGRVQELARNYQLSGPVWTADDSRKLHRPWFASPLAALRAVLLLESPPAFRARKLFVSENALARA
jgi:hypothetical protein